MDHARIDARAVGPETGWVTVAKAAAALTDLNDPIDASNVSRYLARFPDIPQHKVGKFRYVDLAALRSHRATNVLVSEKQASREVPPTRAKPVPAPAIEIVGDDESEEGNSLAGSAVQQANLKLKNLQIRERELDIAEREGALIADVEVLALLSGTMEAFVAALEREEVTIATNHGREFASAFRKGRKSAQAAAAKKLLELAQKFLPDSLAVRITDSPPAGEAAA